MTRKCTKRVYRALSACLLGCVLYLATSAVTGLPIVLANDSVAVPFDALKIEAYRTETEPGRLVDIYAQANELSRWQRDDLFKNLASNSSSPMNLLSLLAKSNSSEIWRRIAFNKNVTIELKHSVIESMAGHWDYKVRESVPGMWDVPERILLKLARSKRISTRKKVAGALRVPPNILLELSKDPYREVAIPARRTLYAKFRDLASENEKSWDVPEKLDESRNNAEALGNALVLSNTGLIELNAYGKEKGVFLVTAEDIVIAVQKAGLEEHAHLILKRYQELVELKGTLPRNDDPETVGQALARSELTTGDHIEWALQNNLLDNKSINRLIMNAAVRNKIDLVEFLSEIGMLEEVDKKFGEQVLGEIIVGAMTIGADYTATISKLVDAGFDPYSNTTGEGAPIDRAFSVGMTSIVRAFDYKGHYTEQLDQSDQLYPANPDSVFVGVWTNRGEGFGESEFRFYPDGTGLMQASVFALPFRWREESEHRAIYRIEINEDASAGEAVKLTDEVVYNQENDSISTSKSNDGFVRVRE